MAALPAVLSLALPVAAQTSETTVTTTPTTGLIITTPYPGISSEPGSTASFPLVVAAPPGERVDLSLEGLPEGWTGTFRGAGAVVSSVATDPSGSPDLRLDVAIPIGTADGAFDLTIAAAGSGTQASLPVTVTVSAGAGGSITLTPDFPGLRGPSDAVFTFNVTVQNDTTTDTQLELIAEGPDGWQVTAIPSGQSQASTISVEAGASTTVTLSAEPPPQAEAGDFEVTMTAQGAGVESELTVQIQLVGDVSMSLTTPDEQLNAEVTSGQPSEFQLLVINDGTAPLTAVSLSATPPQNWTVEFAPEAIDQLAPGEAATVVATITPSTDAIAGDYIIDFSGASEGANDSVEIRTTVSPSTLWGIVGVGLIALTFVALAAVFRRYGRR